MRCSAFSGGSWGCRPDGAGRCRRFSGLASAINLNVHFHILSLDGLYTRASEDLAPRFHELPALTPLDVAELEQVMVARILGLARRRGWTGDESDATTLEPSAQEHAGAASIRQRVAFGRRRGQRVRRLGALPAHLLDDDDDHGIPARPEGFSLFAGGAVAGTNRDRLEALARYLARPALSVDRLARRADGRYTYRLARPWRDGTTHVLFSPTELLEKLTALVPPKRMALLRYHGVLAPASRWRPAIVPTGPNARPRKSSEDGARRRGVAGWIPWSELFQRVHRVDVLRCPTCGGRREILAYLTQPSVVSAILAARGLPTEARPRRRAHRQAVFDA